MEKNFKERVTSNPLQSLIKEFPFLGKLKDIPVSFSVELDTKKEIHIWLTASDYRNANLMILLGYIIMGHKEWRGSEIKLFAVYPEDTIDKERERLFEKIELGVILPISR